MSLLPRAISTSIEAASVILGVIWAVELVAYSLLVLLFGRRERQAREAATPS